MKFNFNLYWFCFLFPIIFTLHSCDNTPKENNSVDLSKLKEPLVNANKHLKNSEEDEINAIVKRYSWDVAKTQTGIRYLIYKKGKGPNIKKDDVVLLKYKLDLIDGTNCYSSSVDGPKIFKIGEGKVENGLEEAAQLLKLGDKAKIIIPSILAYGLLGDNKKIPKRATLVYDIEVVKIN